MARAYILMGSFFGRGAAGPPDLLSLLITTWDGPRTSFPLPSRDNKEKKGKKRMILDPTARGEAATGRRNSFYSFPANLFWLWAQRRFWKFRTRGSIRKEILSVNGKIRWPYPDSIASSRRILSLAVFYWFLYTSTSSHCKIIKPHSWTVGMKLKTLLAWS
jgi:hypothetical protein